MSIIIPECEWINSQLSIARYTGAVIINEKEYRVCGDSHDLVRKDYVALYKKIGRRKLQQYIQQGKTAKEIRIIINQKNGND